MTDLEFLEKEIAAWKCSPRRMMQIKGFLYYDGDHDVIHRKRTMIGEGGELEVVENLPNNRIVDNQYAKMVNQKANYLFGKPFTLSGENTAYIELLKKIFDKKFMRTLKSAGKAAYNGGIAWLYPYYNERGEFAFRFFPAYEILPFWKDSEHTELDFFIRHYVTVAYDGNQRKFIEKVELYDLNGVHLFILDGGKLIPDIVNNETADFPHVTMTDAAGNVQVFNWQRVPLIPLKANEQETPLIKKVKSLQDGINVMLSDFENNMQEDARKDDRLSGNPNQMNIQSMYSDIDTDANDTESEAQATMDDVLWFINCHLANTGQGDHEGEEVDIIFNRDMLMNESDIIDNCQKSQGIISDETIISMHPWVDDPQLEMERLKKQKEEAQKEMLAQYDPFSTQNQNGDGADDDPDNKGDPSQGSQGGEVDE